MLFRSVGLRIPSNVHAFKYGVKLRTGLLLLWSILNKSLVLEEEICSSVWNVIAETDTLELSHNAGDLGYVVTCLRSHLEARYFSLAVTGHTSERFPVQAGVSQRSVPGMIWLCSVEVTYGWEQKMNLVWDSVQSITVSVTRCWFLGTNYSSQVTGSQGGNAGII